MALATEYRNPKKVRPEIFAIGARQPYTLTLDPVRRWAAFGECGPDNQLEGNTEESNVVPEPGNYGWPYFAGKNNKGENLVVNRTRQENTHQKVVDPNQPINISRWNKGVAFLPPAVPGTYSYAKNCAMGGPIIRYNPSLKSTIKLPPHFHRKWLITDFKQGWYRSVELSKDGKDALGSERVFKNIPNRKPLDFKIGPDGALYVMFYGQNGYSTQPGITGISRIEYTGDCLPGPDEFSGKVEKTGCADTNYVEYDPDIPIAFHDSTACKTSVMVQRNGVIVGLLKVHTSAGQVVVGFPRSGKFHLDVTDVSGAQVYTSEGAGVRQTSFPAAELTAGVYMVTVTLDGRRHAGRLAVVP